MSRSIQLTRIHAINWYGYRDSFDISGNVLIAGVTGSGKSVLMDLLQFVLIGNQHKVRYNLSATGDRSTRDLKGYCLGDTKQDVEGVPQFMRNGGITYVALEFTWPGSRQPRVETWGLRIEFENSAQANGVVKAFLIPASWRRDDFLDLTKCPLELATFRQKVEGTIDKKGNAGRMFTGVEEFRREMALPSHLNFDRATLDYLLPAAMSFTFMDSFNDFCRRYILPAEAIDIQGVRDSYIVFRNLQAELARLRDQQERLERIHDFETQRSRAEVDSIVSRFLEAECRRDDAQEQFQEAQRKVADLEKELSAETERLKELSGQITRSREQIRSIEASFNASEDGKLYRRILKENNELAARIQRLTAIGNSIAQARELRARNVAKWRDQLARLSFEVPSGPLTSIDKAIDTFAKCPGTDLRQQTVTLAAAVHAALDAAKSAAAHTVNRNQTLEREINDLEATRTALRSGVLTENSVLLAALNSRLPRRGAEPAAHAMWQLCEVTDETWRPALEVAFGRKFAIVVSEADYDRAEQIYFELKDEARGESLINPKQALALAGPPQPHSLATKIEIPSRNPVAKALVNHLFGEVICVKNIKELRDHPRAITPDGFMAQRPFVQRPRHYDHRPCIGRRGLEKQQAYLQSEIDRRRAEQLQLKPALDAWRDAQKFFSEARLDSESIHDDLAEAARLPEVQSALDNNLAELQRIRSSDFESREQELREANQRYAALEEEQRQLLTSPRRHQLDSEQRRLTAAGESFAREQNHYNEICAETDISQHLKRVDELRREMLSQFPVKSAAAAEFHDLSRDAKAESDLARTQLINERRALSQHPDYGSRYAEIDPETPDNNFYESRLQRIREAEVKEYEQKAHIEQQNWQDLFRRQVLEKLRERLLMVENLMALLKASLDKPIGNNRYQVKATANRDREFEVYRALLDLSALPQDDGSLFGNANAEIRQAIDIIFKSITGESASAQSDAFLDYRNYFDYDILVSNELDPEARPYSVNRQAGKSSGGENQTPYFIAILASYLRAYRRHESRRKEPSLALVPIDEAFSKLSGERIHDCLTALKQLDLQGIFSMSTGNIPYAIDDCDQVIAVHKQEKTVGRKTHIRNIAACLTRSDAFERFSSLR